MKNFAFLAVLSAVVMFLSSCGPKEVKQRFVDTNYATVTLEGTNCYGVINLINDQEIIPQRYSSINYYVSGYFLAEDSSGVQLFDTDGQLIIPTQDRIKNKGDYFEFQRGSKKGFYFIKTQTKISGDYETLEVDQAGNILFMQDGKAGILNRQGKVVIPGEYSYLIYDGTHYNVAKNKNDKRPIVGKNGKANWSLAEAYVFDKEGKQIKKLTSAQAKKIFEGK